MKRLALIALAAFTLSTSADAQVTPQPKPTVGKYRTIITSSSATTCTNIEAGPGWLVELVNTGPALAAYPQFYDEGGSPTCAQADLIYGDGTTATQLQSGQILLLTVPTVNGISMKITGTMPSTQNLIITRI